jgi:hypothetical protein
MVPGFVGGTPESLPRLKLMGILAANGVPLVGVATLGWQPTTLILLYWVEFSVVVLAALVRAAFAGRPSELDDDLLVLGALARRSLHVTVPRTDIGVRGSSVPVLLIATPLLALLWFAVSGVTVGVVGVADPEQPEWLLGLAVLTIVVAEVGRTGVEYFYQRAYREHSAQTALRGVLFRGGALFLVGLCVVVVAAPADASASSAIREPGSVGVPLLLGIVALKTALDLVDQYADRIEAYDEATDVSLGFTYDPPADRAVDDTVSEGAEPVRPALLGRLFGGIPTLVRYPNTAVVGVFIGVVALLFATGRVWSVAAPLGAAAVVVPFGLSSVDHWLRYASVEYRVDDDAIVAHDRLFRQPLWRVEPWDERSLRVERDWLDGRLGTETVVVELDDDTLRLPYLEHPETVLATFDRRPDRPAE